MIFYFSGTGNSLYIAKDIATKQKEEILSISKEMNLNKDVYEYTLKDNEKIVFIFPIYAWAPPKIVLDFINKLKINNYKENYLCSIATCGENIGNAMDLLSKKLKEKELNLNSGFSLVMPNNYMIAGDVFSKEESIKIIKASDIVLEDINKIISNKEKNILKVAKGPMPQFMTSVINPCFNKFAINSKKFYVNDNCIGCKICEKVCNTKCITVDKVPSWGENCTQCLACINYCPKRAIEFGKNTYKKGRYTNPYIDIEEMNI
ncbi:EFR1 family ferrodoxin [Romboutsia sp.]|uniref:EFR1 family ferrodoxin n=1 Tax=Romboutsia sp. TaxID=1965302 RepID=UPI003F2B5D72